MAPSVGTGPDLPGPGARVLVAGLGVSGQAVARALLELGAQVLGVEESAGPAAAAAADALRPLGLDVRVGPASTDLLAAVDLVVTSPGWRPEHPLLRAAADAGVPVWGEVELAWRMRPPGQAWLAVTGTNGKTTTTRMLARMLSASGARAGAAGNVGTPLVEVVRAEPALQVLAVELSSFQLHWSATLAVHSAAVLNLAPDHLDWHGCLPAYQEAKGRIFRGVQVACVYNVADPATEELARSAEVAEGARLIGFGLGVPRPGQLGIIEDLLVDRAFPPGADGVGSGATELAAVADIDPPSPHNVANALAAAALARAFGVPAGAVRDGLRGFVPDPHRLARLARVEGVDFVDDSKATNPHAAAASLGAFASVVWVAGGLAKGADFDDLVRQGASRLRGVVLLGRDRGLIRDALARHAPDVPVVDIAGTDTGVMDEVVRAAAGLARPGDTVLLAPACASMDLFSNYAARGDAFAEAVTRLARGAGR